MPSQGRGGGLPELRPHRKERLERIKRELNYTEWRGKTRGGRKNIALGLCMDPLAPSGIRCTSVREDSPVPTYAVNCHRQAEGGKAQRIRFLVRVSPSVESSHELLLRRFVFTSAPMSYLKQQWAKDKPAYGDISFGTGYWATGNVLVELTDGAEHKAFVKRVFGHIDRALNALPKAAGPAPRGMALAVAPADEPRAWDVTVGSVPPHSQVVVSFKGPQAKRTDEHTVRVVASGEDGKGIVSIVVIAKGQMPRSFEASLAPGPRGRR